MSLLGEIKNFIKTELLGIENNTPVHSAPKEKDSTPIITCKNVGKNEDVLEKQETKENQTIKTAGCLSLGALKENLKNLGIKYSFTSKEFKPEGLIKKLTGLSDDEFNKLSAEDRTRIQNAVAYAMKEYSEMSKKGLVNKDAGIEQLTVEFSKLVYEALTSGAFKNVQDYSEAVGDINKELGENFKNLSIEEQRKTLKAKRAADDRALETELVQADNLPQSEQEGAKNRIITRHRFVRRGRYMQLATQQKSETAMNGLVILKSDDIAWGAKTTLSTRCSEKERTQTADYADYSFTKGLIKDFKTFEDEIKPESLKAYSCTVVTYKSEKGVKSYQQSYVDDRNKYEKAIEKQARGEALTAEEQELLTIMSNDYYTATAQAIGEGALNNVNMTSSEKAEFINQWENDARKYSDYAIVTRDVKDALATNPQYKEIADKLEKIKITEANKTAANRNKKEETKEAGKTNYKEVIYSDKSDGKAILKPTQKGKNIPKIVSNPLKNKTKNNICNNPIIVATEVKKLGIEEAIENYGKADVITAILDDNSLKHLRPLLATIIKSYDKNSIKEIAANCSDSAFVYICSIVDGDMIAELTENRRDLCFAARNQIENMEKEYETA